MKILLFLALLPAFLLMRYIYKKDTIEKEPVGLLLVSAVAGALACIPAAWLEEFFLQVLDTFLAPGTIGYAAAEAFLIVAIAEEGCKLFFLKKLTWKSSHFNYRFDGIIFAVFTGLGFAGLENILYVLNFGPDVLVSRGLLAVPGHMTFAVFMGLHYSESKLASLRGQHSKAKRSLRKAFLVPVLLHGFYDFCLMSERDILSIVFILFVIVLDLSAARAVRRTSRNDHPL
jgi:RsiW-degrading membrane proteinase PrsW (M82 family)